MSGEGLIISPLITEKGTLVTEKANQVVFRVRRAASKDVIRTAIALLGVGAFFQIFDGLQVVVAGALRVSESPAWLPVPATVTWTVREPSSA